MNMRSDCSGPTCSPALNELRDYINVLTDKNFTDTPADIIEDTVFVFFARWQRLKLIVRIVMTLFKR